MFEEVSDIDNYFKNFDLNDTLCLDPNQNLTLTGLKSDNNQKVLSI